ENNSIWIGTRTGVDIIQSTDNSGGSPVITTLKGLPADDVASMGEDREGRVLMSVGKKLLAYENGRFLEVKKQDGSLLDPVGNAQSIIAGNDNDFWAVIAGDKHRLLLRIKDFIVREEIPLDGLVSRAEKVAVDREGGIWIGAARDKLIRYRNGQIETVMLGDAGETVIYSLRLDSEDSLWAATNKGMFRWKNGVLSRLDSQSGLPCSTFFSAIEDDSGNFWLYARCGLLEIPASSISTWRQQPESKVSYKIYDALDGALPSSGAVHQPSAAKAKDGRLWFLNGKSAQMIDPNVSYSNKMQPPVYIEGLVANRQSYPIQSQVNLPPLRGELQIDYTALSYAVPQKVNFRYRLEGHEENWHDPGTRRQAFYNDLAPGQYRFRVIATGGDGIWNETGATLDFAIEPAWYQTTAFRLLCLLLAGLLVWSLYRLRIRQISKVINARFDERLAERTRLARELHDTFLQTIQGSKLVADDALEKPDDPVQMRRTIEQLSLWLGLATDEGRAALNSLRTTTVETNDLAEALRRAAETCRLKENAEVKFSVVGEPKEMHPIVRDEIYRIGYEAIRNACQHSNASHLLVELGYGQDIIVRIKDNGGGIDPVVTEEGKPKHFGLKGMRERAERIGAKLTITSSANSGTEVTLIVLGAFVFRKPGDTPLKT
ncbi:MAG TPA: triple tyrosine motif-containing protein, partial [Pyrinomonadaceae bacterium]